MSRRPVLVVDDDEGVREAVAEVLADVGYIVATAANGQLALDWLRSHPPPALILLDLMMPVMDGQQFRAAQVADPALRGIPVVVITAGGDRSLQAAMATEGWLHKPIELDVLLETLATWCGPP
jgi:CheY-like chemotaxis protein